MKKSTKKSIRGTMLLLLIILLSAKSCMVKAQSVHNYTYYGYGIAFSTPQHTLRSNISQLNGLNVSLLGCNLGGMIANNHGKLKANVGTYYSDASVPYEIDMISASVSGNIYLLRLNKVEAHLFEPYVTVGVSQQTSKFYGDYLSNDPLNPSKQPLLGKVNTSRIDVGAGVEVQMENDNQKFIHVFAEVAYGAPLASSASNKAFSQTKAMSMITFNFGVNFGIVKIDRKK